MMQLLDGKLVSAQILESLKSRIQNLGSRISLHTILVGNDPNSLKYVAMKEKKAKEVGINFFLHHLPEGTTEAELLNLVEQLNRDPQITGFFIQLPIPGIHKNKILPRISPKKDVDGLNPASGIIPAVVAGTLRLLDFYQIPFAEKTAVIINDSQLIGQPLQKLLLKRQMKVSICNEFTKNIPEISRGADFIFSATGKRGLVTTDYIKPGAIVIDIGGGDIDFEDVKVKCSYITPTTGGIGPMTIACLLENLVNLAVK